ncbi:MAG TPA: hypothetical protein VIL47_04060 [Candidatus Bipolaricaulota bacterium]
MRIGWMVVLTVFLGGVLAPLALAGAHPYQPMIYEHYMPKEEAHQMMEAVFYLKHHPGMLHQLNVERTMWLLKGVKHMQQIPFADQDALFDLQLNLSLHLLDLQVQRLHAMTGYGYPMHPMDMGKPMDHGHDMDMGKPMDMPMDGHQPSMDHEKMDEHYGHLYPVIVIKPIIVIKKEHTRMSSFMAIRVDKERFRSSAACHMSQESMTRKHAWDRDIFVGPCQQVSDHVWTFNVWNV